MNPSPIPAASFAGRPSMQTIDDAQLNEVAGGLRKQVLASGTVVYRGFGPAPIG
jgi:hypothetical protein